MSRAVDEATWLAAAGVRLDVDVHVPRDAVGVVVLPDAGTGTRHSARSAAVAGELQRGGLATVVADLLTTEDKLVAATFDQRRADVDLLAARLAALASWTAEHEPTSGLRLGLYGADTGAAACLDLAADRPELVRTVVCAGARLDLADPMLARVTQSVLLLVGERDRPLIELTETAASRLGGKAAVIVVPGASHRFEEPGALEAVAELARDWFVARLPVEADG
ncbi:MAG: dienelactone hydrolase [Frankiales bacterium]|jgi:putative phosphoribosyl transferase|nr:dienelactone hydrolase [Frankiales bacterium]